MATKMNVKPAASSACHVKGSPISLLSLDLGQLVPSRVIECNLGDNWSKVKAQGRMFLAPQQFPPYGKSSVKSAAFFVPEEQLIEYSDAIHAGNTVWKGVNPLVPWFYSTDLNALFVQGNSYGFQFSTKVGSTVASPANAPAYDTYDFCMITNANGASNYSYYKLTLLGRYIYKILKGLGYEFASFANESVYNTNYNESQIKVNAMPLLAYLKCYTDWFLNRYNYNESPMTYFLKCIHDNSDCVMSSNTYFTASSARIYQRAIGEMLQYIFLPHEQNMYLEAWNNLDNPNGSFQNPAIYNGTLMGAYMPLSTYAGVPVDTQNIKGNTNDINVGLKTSSGSSVFDNLSAFGLKILDGAYKFIMRNGLAGNPAAKRLLARFGVDPDTLRTNFVHKLYEGASLIQFHPVYSNTDNQSASGGKSLGDYAGMGISGLDFGFNYRCNGFGYIVVLHWIQITPILVHGMHPANLHVNPLEFYTPEFDGKASRAIPYAEISSDKQSVGVIGVSAIDKGIFGFTRLYQEYRRFRDNVIGDFVVGGAKNFFFGRDLSILRVQGSRPMKAQDLAVQCYSQTNNIDMVDPFQSSASNGDRFLLQLQYDIAGTRRMLSEEDSLELGEGDTTIEMNGNGIS